MTVPYHRNGLGNLHPDPNAPIKTTPNAWRREHGFNVVDYGAVGDGKTDDTAAVQRAITAAAGESSTRRCIVAVPAATEPVHHMGDVSEPKHLTLVNLGKPEENPALDMDQVRGQVESVAERSGPLTGLVESTGELGDDGATVWFVRGDGINEVRDDLLSQPHIKDGFGAAEQFPSFTPHVTAGYDMDDPVTEENSPDQVVFDRLAVWDGDEHTEYPLGPSAESTLPEGPSGLDGFEQALAEAMTAPIEGAEFADGWLVCFDGSTKTSRRVAVPDAATLGAAVAHVETLPDDLSRAASRRVLTKRARELGCQHLIPTSWFRQAVTQANVASGTGGAAVAGVPGNVNDVTSQFEQKTELSGLSDTALRAAYMRGVRDYTMTAQCSRPPLPRDVVAQARVNSLIRLAQGDPSARTDDQDLLP